MPLHVDSVGRPAASAVVFLHGVGAGGWMWWRQVPAFADHLCLNVDLPGHGRSRDVPWISLADTAEQVAAVVRTRTASGRAHVVGLSLGGHVALAVLDRHADVLDRVVVSGVTAEPWPCPWLVGVRESDVIRRAVESIPAAVPAATGGIVPGARHAWNIDAPDLFNATVRAWIGGSPLPPSLRPVQ